MSKLYAAPITCVKAAATSQPTQSSSPKLLYDVEVGEWLRYSAFQLRRLARKGHLPHFRLADGEYRFVESEILEYLNAHHQPGACGCACRVSGGAA